MKLRILRTIGVGAALLIPVSLAVLDSGVAGATVLSSTSTAAFGTTTLLGHITLVGVTANLTSVTSAAWSNATGRPISTSSHLKANIVAMQRKTGTTTAKIPIGATVTIAATGGTTGENHCKITLEAPVTLNRTTSHPIWFGSTERLAATQTTVTGCATSTLNSVIHDEITGTKVNVTETN